MDPNRFNECGGRCWIEVRILHNVALATWLNLQQQQPMPIGVTDWSNDKMKALLGIWGLLRHKHLLQRFLVKPALSFSSVYVCVG